VKVSGFTFIRNALKYDYPVEAAIRSILPLCDKVYVAVGQSEDDTLALIRSIDPAKIIIQETEWNNSLREGGRVLALETDKAYAMIPEDTDWCFYIQADEVVHESQYKVIRDAMELWKNDSHVDGLLFSYRHFYGSYDYIGASSSWYKNEIRIIKKRNDIFSYRDAQGFRKHPNQKLNVKAVDAFIHHYGWVKHPEKQQLKQQYFHSLWHDDSWMKKNIPNTHTFDYSNIDNLEKFNGTHPTSIIPWIENVNWSFEHDISKSKLTFKDRLKKTLQRITGKSIGIYANYKLLK
jgi:hypothetical protein